MEECLNIFILIGGLMDFVDDVVYIFCVILEYICLDNKQFVIKIDYKGNILSKYEFGDFWGSVLLMVDENGDLFIIR